MKDVLIDLNYDYYFGSCKLPLYLLREVLTEGSCLPDTRLQLAALVVVNSQWVTLGGQSPERLKSQHKIQFQA